MVDKFIFDVDGTLTPSRREIDMDFAVFFTQFCAEHDVYLVTGSDRDKTIEQVGEEIYSLSQRSYNCSGSDVWQGNKHLYTSEWKIPKEAEDWLRAECRVSDFPLRTGLHIEKRPGMVNFSVVGRNATMGERKLYVEFDTVNKERVRIAKDFQMLFPAIQAVVGGETGIDIFPRGKDKSQIVKDFDPNDILHFFGDRMDKAGNDYPLKKVILDNDLGMCYSVKDWKHTWKLLKEHD
mgnify:FL=1|tara:strand:- start:10419 stop:11126 length:708 start_codon:yes stop_codon:yes gene_type:complete